MNIIVKKAAGVLVGAAALTAIGMGTASAATPVEAGTAAHAVGSTPAPQFSRGFNLGDYVSGTTMELVNATGDNEGMPAIGTVMQEGSTQHFEVQYEFMSTGNIYATYQLNNASTGQFLGDVEVHMSYDGYNPVQASVDLDSTGMGLLVGSAGDPNTGWIEP